MFYPEVRGIIQAAEILTVAVGRQLNTRDPSVNDIRTCIDALEVIRVSLQEALDFQEKKEKKESKQ